MPPKPQKQERAQAKADEKAKAKVVEDKTFGLKNKNKSKAVQQKIKGMQQQIQGTQKGGEGARLQKEYQEKDAKKKQAAQEALLQSLFRGAEKAGKEKEDARLHPQQLRKERKIDLYTDPRDLAGVEREIDAELTNIMCKHFLEAVEKDCYGWFWKCTNGDGCKYRHCLPEGYIVKTDISFCEETEEESLEEQIERERNELPPGGTPVTYQSFMDWKKRTEEVRLQVAEKRLAEASRSGKATLLSGRALFAYDPSLFVDDEGAADGMDYESDGAAEAVEAMDSEAVDSDGTDEGNRQAQGEAEADEACVEPPRGDSLFELNGASSPASKTTDGPRKPPKSVRVRGIPVNVELFLDDGLQNLEEDWDGT